MIFDKDIREPLFDFLEQKYGKIRILEEHSMGRSRADIVMVLQNALCGIEIKSDADTYARLTRQVRDYDKYYDHNIVVVGASHALHIEEHAPAYWGIITVDLNENNPELLDFYILREPAPNPKLNLERKIEILWRPELAHIQQITQMPAYREKSKRFVSDKIVKKIPKETLDHLISEELFERDYSTIEEEINTYRQKHRK